MRHKHLFLVTLFCYIATAVSFSQDAKEWANFNRYAADNKALTKSPKVVFMGNSITDAWIRVSPEFFADNNYADRGISGQTTSEMLVRFREDVIKLKPQAVTILAGINDIAQNNGVIALEHVFGNIVSMVELAKANGIKVVLCSVLPAYDFSWRPGLEPAGKVKDLNKMIKNYAAANGYTYVDYHSALTDERGGLPKKYANDGVHPNKDGYIIMENLIQTAINTVIQ